MITSARSGLARSGNTRSGLSVVLLEGITRDNTGAPLPFVTVDLFDTLTNTFQQTTLSDAVGHYAFEVYPTVQYYMVAYLAGTPDVAGTTRNDLVGV